VNLKKKLEWYWRVNLLGPGPRLMRKEFTGLRSHKGWETLLYITLVKVTRRCPWLHHSVLWCLCAIWWWHSRTYVLHHFQIDFFLKKNHTCVHILPLLNKTVMGDNLSPSLCLSLSLTHTHTYTHTHTHTRTIIIIIISFMELGHLLTHSSLMYPEVSSKVYHDSFCQLGSTVRGSDA